MIGAYTVEAVYTAAAKKDLAISYYKAFLSGAEGAQQVVTLYWDEDREAEGASSIARTHVLRCDTDSHQSCTVSV